MCLAAPGRRDRQQIWEPLVPTSFNRSHAVRTHASQAQRSQPSQSMRCMKCAHVGNALTRASVRVSMHLLHAQILMNAYAAHSYKGALVQMHACMYIQLVCYQNTQCSPKQLKLQGFLCRARSLICHPIIAVAYGVRYRFQTLCNRK